MIRLRSSDNFDELLAIEKRSFPTHREMIAFLLLTISYAQGMPIAHSTYCPPKTTPGLFVGIAFAGGVIVTGWLNLLRSTVESRATVAFDGRVVLPLALGVAKELKSASALTFSSVRCT